jgi:hypothetical protein
MSTTINFILLIVLGVGVIFMLVKVKSELAKNNKSKANNFTPAVANKNNILQKDETKNLSLEEKINLSWGFLINITEQVLTNFSKQDQKKVDMAGDVLLKNGVRYQHNVESEAKTTLHIINTREKSKDQSLSR